MNLFRQLPTVESDVGGIVGDEEDKLELENNRVDVKISGKENFGMTIGKRKSD